MDSDGHVFIDIDILCLLVLRVSGDRVDFGQLNRFRVEGDIGGLFAGSAEYIVAETVKVVLLSMLEIVRLLVNCAQSTRNNGLVRGQRRIAAELVVRKPKLQFECISYLGVVERVYPRSHAIRKPIRRSIRRQQYGT